MSMFIQNLRTIKEEAIVFADLQVLGRDAEIILATPSATASMCQSSILTGAHWLQAFPLWAALDLNCMLLLVIVN